jgi:hypothetical protein
MLQESRKNIIRVNALRENVLAPYFRYHVGVINAIKMLKYKRTDRESSNLGKDDYKEKIKMLKLFSFLAFLICVQGPMLKNFLRPYLKNVCNKLEFLSPGKPFQPSLMFASKAGAHLSGCT